MSRGFSRREMLRRAAAAGAATAVPRAALAQLAADGAQTVPETLAEPEYRILQAIVARLVPSDVNGPGALEAGAAHYIDRALADALAVWLETYVAGLRAIDAHARAAAGGAFAALEPAAQDSILEDLERDALDGFTPNAAAFFELLLTHTVEGTFSDPYYGGNRDFIGWDLLGYPGIRLAVGPAEQRLSVPPDPTRLSAYDFPMFESLLPEGGESDDR